MSTVKELYDKPGAATYYGLTRGDVVDFLGKYLQQHQLQPESALEIGCSSGGTGKLIKEQLGVQFYAGLELMEPAAQQAQAHLDWVACGNIEEMINEDRLAEIPNRQYDMILFLDVLEHLYNPWRTLEATQKLLKPGGLLIGSIPNLGNLYILLKILRDRFEYDEEGLLDRTHIRWFTEHTIRKMVGQHFHLRELGTRQSTWKTMNWKLKIIKVGTLGLWKRLFIRQYLFIAEKK